MKTKLGLLLLMLLIAVGCDDSTETEQATEPVPSDPPVVELPSITNTLGMKFNKIPAGTFLMGSPKTEKSRRDIEHQHKVTISKAFYIQTTEVTQSQWTAVMGTEPWKGEDFVKEGSGYAATCVSWDDAIAFCKKLNDKKGKTYRLPTEAEWEYACRAGTKTTWNFGNNEKVLGDYAWYADNAYDIDEKYAHQVGLKKPNAFGLYDMHGNVWEWCHDYYRRDYYKQSPEQDPQGPASGYSRVLRGGSWGHGTRLSRSVSRSEGVAADRNYYVFGFRVVRELDSPEKAAAAVITAAIAKGDWETVLALDATNIEGLRLKAAAITAAIAKGDWETVLVLDATNSDGLRLQAAAEKAAILAGDPITNTLGMTLNKIPAGTFMMGSPKNEEGRFNNEDQHKVTISKAFYMQTTEVTQGQWKALMGRSGFVLRLESETRWQGGRYFKEGPNTAATFVSWNDAVAYCKKLSEKEGKTYRLPTEAEWEYACRAGTQTTWSFGNDEKVLGDYAWYDKSTYDVGDKYAYQVGLKKPNAFGLHDMHGNVTEWCHDYYAEDYYKQSSEKDPTGPTSGSSCVLWGGSWFSNSSYARSAFRFRDLAHILRYGIGFRVVRELD